jgi:hypothetical protein
MVMHGAHWCSGHLCRLHNADDILEEKALGTAIYGVMYTVCKEKTRYSWAFVSCRLLFDWLQL